MPMSLGRGCKLQLEGRRTLGYEARWIEEWMDDETDGQDRQTDDTWMDETLEQLLDSMGYTDRYYTYTTDR